MHAARSTPGELRVVTLNHATLGAIDAPPRWTWRTPIRCGCSPRLRTALDERETYLIGMAQRPTIANDGFRMHGLMSDSGHALLATQTWPSPLASDMKAGT